MSEGTTESAPQSVTVCTTELRKTDK